MFRWIVVLAAIALAGCATDYHGYGYGYHDRYHDDVYVGTYYRDLDRSGDYYYRDDDYGYDYDYGYRDYGSWSDYPGYYSLFWDLNRSVFDPYWHPGFYYGVTWFPRNYFGFSYYRGGWPRSYYSYRPYRSLWYSPYRSAWVDSYYDWYPYYYRHDRYRDHYAPRYGNARNEAERLARWESRNGRSDGLPGSRDGRYVDRDRVVRNPDRNADYGGQTRPRLDPGVRGYDRPGAADRRSADFGRDNRLDPNRRGIDRPRLDGREPVVRNGIPGRPVMADSPRDADYGRPADRTLLPGRIDPNVRGYDRGVPADPRVGEPVLDRGERGYTVRTPARPQNGYPLDGLRRETPQRPVAGPRQYPQPTDVRGSRTDLPQRTSPREFSAPPAQPRYERAAPPRYERSGQAQTPRYERPSSPQRSASPPAMQRPAPPPTYRAPPPSREAAYGSESREERRESRQDARDARQDARAPRGRRDER